MPRDPRKNPQDDRIRAQHMLEAAAKVSPVGRARIANIPWGVVVGMRNRLVHGYDEINFEVVWKVATEEVHDLIAALEGAFVHWPLETGSGPTQ